MKSAYEIAMEKLGGSSVKLSTAQKQELKEIEDKYKALIAAREIALNGEIARAADDVEKEESLREQLMTDRKKLLAEMEEKKERVRSKK
jgi:hypothetical protein